MDEVVLSLNPQSGRVEMAISEVGGCLCLDAAAPVEVAVPGRHNKCSGLEIRLPPGSGICRRRLLLTLTFCRPALPPAMHPHAMLAAALPPQVSPPNQGHKKRCMLGLLQDTVEEHNAEVAALLRERGGGKELRLIVETEDFGVTWRASKWKLPAFAMCTGAARCVICHCGQSTTVDAWEMPRSRVC